MPSLDLQVTLLLVFIGLMNISESMYWKIVCVREVNMGGAIATVVLADRSDTVHIL